MWNVFWKIIYLIYIFLILPGGKVPDHFNDPGVGDGPDSPGMLQSMGSQRVGQDWATKLNWMVTAKDIYTDKKESVFPRVVNRKIVGDLLFVKNSHILKLTLTLYCLVICIFVKRSLRILMFFCLFIVFILKRVNKVNVYVTTTNTEKIIMSK